MEQDPGKGTAMGRRPRRWTNRPGQPHQQSLVAGVQGSGAWKGASSSSEWAAFLQAFGPSPKGNEDPQSVLRERTA